MYYEGNLQRQDKILVRAGYPYIRDGGRTRGSSLDHTSGSGPGGLYRRIKTGKALRLLYGFSVGLGVIIAVWVWGI